MNGEQFINWMFPSFIYIVLKIRACYLKVRETALILLCIRNASWRIIMRETEKKQSL